jgi:hypothetical protein
MVTETIPKDKEVFGSVVADAFPSAFRSEMHQKKYFFKNIFDIIISKRS